MPVQGPRRARQWAGCWAGRKLSRSRVNLLKEETQLLREEMEGVRPPSTDDTAGDREQNGAMV